MSSAPRALIAGLGLIGGSIGMALRTRGWRVAFVDGRWADAVQKQVHGAQPGDAIDDLDAAQSVELQV